ncbi:MAG: TIM barrel protein [Planctomycetes bacterium]|nr:TIM barrel protein [Planctomycetota bacterium]
MFITQSLCLATLAFIAPTNNEDVFPETYAVNVEMWWRNLPFIDRIHAAADAGFTKIEFWPWQGKDIDAIAKVCKERSIEVAQFTAWGFVPGMNDPKNHKQFVEKIKKSCEIAKQLNCKRMTVVGGNNQPNMTQEEMHQNIIDGLTLAKPIVEKAGVMLILEPMNIRVDHKGHCLYGSEDAVRICREVNSPMIKINWDLYHMQISEGDLCGRLRDGFDQVGYIQVADHPGRHEPGTGEIYYPRVYKELKRLGYTGPIGLECSPAADETSAIARLKDFP